MYIYGFGQPYIFVTQIDTDLTHVYDVAATANFTPADAQSVSQSVCTESICYLLPSDRERDLPDVLRATVPDIHVYRRMHFPLPATHTSSQVHRYTRTHTLTHTHTNTHKHTHTHTHTRTHTHTHTHKHTHTLTHTPTHTHTHTHTHAHTHTHTGGRRACGPPQAHPLVPQQLRVAHELQPWTATQGG